MIFSYNLQYFAKDGPGGEKTEEPTSKKIEDSRKEGQVAKSKELNNAVSLLALFILIKIWAGNMGNSFIQVFSGVYNKIPDAIKLYQGEFSFNTIYGLIRDIMIQILIILFPFFLIGFLVAFLVDLIQVKWKPTTKPLEPKWNKMSPIKGMKRLFSKDKMAELLKSIVKIVLVIYVAYGTLKGETNTLLYLYDMPIGQALLWLGETLSNMGIKIAVFYLIVGFVDYIYQKWKHHEEIMMTKQEIKDEFKNAEGDPKIKSQIRQKMMQASMRRMMQSVPQADVVITNPTHYAVAIKYEPEKYTAPIVLAKGEDYLALKIKEQAKEHKIEIIENKPLARMLYANVDVGGVVPPELYQAVAEILAMVYQMQGKI